MTLFSRRDFVRLLVATGLGSSLPLYSSSAAPTLPNRLNKLLTAKTSAQEVGRRYLQLFPREADAQLLARLICRSKRRYARLSRVDARTLRELLVRQQRQDFQHRRTVTIDGWMLSETEARLCAISALV